jgi:adenylate cyclase
MVDAPVAGGTLASTYVHANALNTLLTYDFLVPASDWSTILLAAAIAFVVGWLTLLIPLWACWIVPIVAGFGVWLGGALLANGGTLPDVGVWYGAILLSFVVAAGGKAAFEFAQRRRIAKLFSRYVPPSVARDLMDDNQAAALLEGEAVNATVLFCDIRGFTSLTSTLSPREVRALLDRYYDTLAPIILDHDGTVLGYVGDEIYAVFGAPAPLVNHERVAVECARAIHAARDELNRSLAELSIPPIAYGIGINVGDLVSAVVGSDVRQQYSVIGNSMNLGSRLCAQAAAGEIVVSEATFSALDETTPPWDPYTTTLKGIDGTPTLYRIRCADTVMRAQRRGR